MTKALFYRWAMFLFLFLACCLSLMAQVGKVALQSGAVYELRNILLLQGGVVPATADPQALMHTTTAPQASGKWLITRKADGLYTIQHAQTGHYMTYDGRRTTHRRYMYLSKTEQGTDSRWRIYPGSTYVIVASASNRQQNHLLNVRRDSRIVGLYRNATPTATDNERFVLIDARGRAVNEIDGKSVVNLLPIDAQTGRFVPEEGASSVSIKQDALAFCVDGRKPVYDERTKTYLFPLSEKDMGKKVSLRVTADDGTALHCMVDGVKTNARHCATFDLSMSNRTFLVSLYKDNAYYTAKLTFTFLPIVEIKTGQISRREFADAALVMHDADVSADSLYQIRIRRRGEYTASFDKGSFGVKLVGRDGKKINRSLAGLRTDNYWILDAMTIDPARLRNRVAMDLWNDFATRPQGADRLPKACFSSRGRLVEVFLNGKYHGVYNLCERIDRKQLQLPKPLNGQARGCLYKAETWNAWTLMGLQPGRKEVVGSAPPPFDGRSETWVGFDAKYPEVGKRETEWSPLYEAIKLVATADRTTFAGQVGQHFDLSVLRDYYLFIELLLAADNSAKNMYWAVLDRQRSLRVFPLPWDLDGSMGQGWSGRRQGHEAQRNYRQFLFAQQHQSGIFERLYREDANGWNLSMAERYRTLRRTYFSPQQLVKRLEHYHRLMKESGATEREQVRWNGHNGVRIDIDAEVKYLQEWLLQRIAYLDRQYGF